MLKTDNQLHADLQFLRKMDSETLMIHLISEVSIRLGMTFPETVKYVAKSVKRYSKQMTYLLAGSIPAATSCAPASTVYTIAPDPLPELLVLPGSHEK